MYNEILQLYLFALVILVFVPYPGILFSLSFFSRFFNLKTLICIEISLVEFGNSQIVL